MNTRCIHSTHINQANCNPEMVVKWSQITLKARHDRLPWYGHIPWMDDEYTVKQTTKMEVRGVRAQEVQE